MKKLERCVFYLAPWIVGSSIAGEILVLMGDENFMEHLDDSGRKGDVLKLLGWIVAGAAWMVWTKRRLARRLKSRRSPQRNEVIYALEEANED